jgi:hypothetical protein
LQQAAYELTTVCLRQLAYDDKLDGHRKRAQATLDERAQAALVGGAEHCTWLQNNKRDWNRAENDVAFAYDQAVAQRRAVAHDVDE